MSTQKTALEWEANVRSIRQKEFTYVSVHLLDINCVTSIIMPGILEYE